MSERQNENVKQRPLLYITQPVFDEAKTRMQHSFIIKQNGMQKEQLKTEEPAQELEMTEEMQMEAAVETMGEQAEEQTEEQLEEIVAEMEEPLQEEAMEQENDDQTAWKSKSFKDMSNEEKIDFLLNRPHYIPKARCQIRTNDETHIGYITSFEDGYVTIRTMTRSRELEVKFEEIVSIRMVGF
jgi:arsenate reductase-like glutaredoxin family protein